MSVRMIARFKKGKEVKYISHLDILRVFQRALIRADILPAYSQGFNPHILLGFASALPVGVMSCAEYLECKLQNETEPEKFAEALNAVMPLGFEILAAKKVEEPFPSLMAITEKADYIIEITEPDGVGSEEIKTVITQMQNSAEMIVERKSKKGMKQIDIKPMIYSLETDGKTITCTLTASNVSNLRPDVLWEEIIRRTSGQPLAEITRTELYFNIDGSVLPLL